MSETWADRIIEALRVSRLPLDDDQLARQLGASRRQIVNQSCLRLARSGVLQRYRGSEGKIVNQLVTTATKAPTTLVADAGESASPTRQAPTALLTEDQVKAAVKQYLEADGWTVRVAWGHERGIDIAAQRTDELLYLEAKGEAANPPQQANYFLGALGELVQRFTDPNASYGLALPDNRQYRRLVERLPVLARDRLKLNIYFVSTTTHLVTHNPS